MARELKDNQPADETLPPEPSRMTTGDDIDNDSDGGNFMDDDTRDCLPFGWVGGEQKKVSTGYKSRKKGARKAIKAKAEVLEVSQVATINKSVQQLTPEPTSATSSLNLDLESPSIADGGEATLVNSSTCTVSSSSGSIAIKSRQNMVSFKRLQVPESSIRHPRTPVQALQEQVLSLRREIEKKDRDFKSANQRAAASDAAKAKAEETMKITATQLDSTMNDLQSGVQKKAEMATELMELRKENINFDAQRRKATSDLRQVRDKYAVLQSRLANTGRNLSVAKEDLTRKEDQIKVLTNEKSGLDSTIARLEREATSNAWTRRTLQQNLDREQTNATNLQSTIDGLRSQVSGLNQQQGYPRAQYNMYATSHTLSPNVRTYENLQRDHDQAQRDITDLNCSYYQERVKRLSAEEKVRELESDRQRHCDEIKQLKDKNCDLERSQTLLQPLVKIGVDIRLRNLELARETALNVPTNEIDRAIILSGNVAAHRAKGTVDAALFESGLVPESYIEEATKVFKALYICAPSDYSSNTVQWGSRIKRVLDCRATIKTLKAVAGSADCSELENEHQTLDNDLSLQHDALINKFEFETDPTVDERLSRLEVITENIVDIKRTQGGRRRPLYSGRTRYFGFDDDDE